MADIGRRWGNESPRPSSSPAVASNSSNSLSSCPVSSNSSSLRAGSAAFSMRIPSTVAAFVALRCRRECFGG
eukprot:5498934-Pyramimonas_sp.AAC.3